MKPLVYFIFYLISHLSLPLLHHLGNFLGAGLFYFSKRTRSRIMANLATAKVASPDVPLSLMAKKVTQETFKTGLELSIALSRSGAYIQSLFNEVTGDEYVRAALQKKEALLLLTPHLGSFDLAGRALADQLPFPVTALYKPAKFAWLNAILIASREKNKVTLAPATRKGVASITRALKRREAVILLPDHVPEAGEGMVVPFFGAPAYTMTLASKLARYPHVTPLFFVGERKEKGRGFNLHIYPLERPLGDDLRRNVEALNQQIETLIQKFPHQYLFSYNRYKIPAACENK